MYLRFAKFVFLFLALGAGTRAPQGLRALPPCQIHAIIVQGFSIFSTIFHDYPHLSLLVALGGAQFNASQTLLADRSPVEVAPGLVVASA